PAAPRRSGARSRTEPTYSCATTVAQLMAECPNDGSEVPREAAAASGTEAAASRKDAATPLGVVAPVADRGGRADCRVRSRSRRRPQPQRATLGRAGVLNLKAP